MYIFLEGGNIMKIEKTTILAFVAITFISGLFTKANANLILNGSFETGPDPGGYWVTLSAGSTAIDGWEVTRGGLDYKNYWEASDGDRSLDLDNSPGFGGIKQEFTTTAGWDYLVTFDIAGNPFLGYEDPAIKHMRVAAAGDFNDFSFDVTGHDFDNMGWQPCSWQFTAIDSLTTIEFYSLDSDEGGYSAHCGPTLDNVSIVEIPIPEPATIALLSLGALALVRKRKA
jgi:choice-of-anchor C domain-containing protein